MLEDRKGRSPTHVPSCNPDYLFQLPFFSKPKWRWWLEQLWGRLGSEWLLGHESGEWGVFCDDIAVPLLSLWLLYTCGEEGDMTAWQVLSVPLPQQGAKHSVGGFGKVPGHTGVPLPVQKMKWWGQEGALLFCQPVWMPVQCKHRKALC